VIYVVPKSQKKIRALWGWALRAGYTDRK